MPYSDPKKEARFRARQNAKRRRERTEARRARLQALGHHTSVSLNWPKRPLSEGQAMWVAAVIDCEGCLSLGEYWNNRSRCRAYRSFAQVQMTDRQVVMRLVTICGGTTRPWRSRRDRNRRQVWVWNLSANGLRWLLPQIQPHLLIKQKQASCLIQFLRICRRGGKRSHLSANARRLHVRLTDLNQRRIAA